ncbi:MAG TPA: methyltransferase domain-containing protein [Candidatus Limnocylindrales bacterium]|nr:methyltransferase domain-containing protein [Candidatus Limnocylindrales bacterium]
MTEPRDSETGPPDRAAEPPDRAAERRDPAPAPLAPTHDAASWDAVYRSGQAPWDTGRPSTELIRVLREQHVRPGAAIELGCGSGTNAVWLAAAGFRVTGLDIAPSAVAMARARAAEAGASVRFVLADLLDPPAELGGPYDFVFDRGCYHAARQFDVDRFLATVEGLLRPGTEGLFLTGNAREPRSGPPVVSEAELRGELGRIFEIVRLREFRMDLRPESGIGRPLGWSCFVRRSPRATPAAGG